MTESSRTSAADRDRVRREFLELHGLGNASIQPLAPDASFRRYYRVVDGAHSLMLMDAPPAHEDIGPYVAVARHLARLGLRAPAIRDSDAAHGFVLLEDFGDDTYTRLLERGVDERELYTLATDVLCHLHTHPDAANIGLESYDVSRLLGEALLLTDWFYPARYGHVVPRTARDAYSQAWTEVLTALPAVPPTLVLRDFHVDNLMRVIGTGGATCGLLDFQDAVLGPGAYDLVSLLEDARRDVDRLLVDEMKERYLECRAYPARALFESQYAVLGVQRHCKVAGIFVRLCVRDGKCRYLRHIPRVLGLLDSHLRRAELAPLSKWFVEAMPDWRNPLPDLEPGPLVR